MKKKLEAELISIAHRILKLKNRAELDQLQQETLKLYEKISVLRFVEDNFNDIKPTIGHASAEDTLEEMYGLEEPQHVHANEVEAAEAAAKEEKKAEKEREEAEAEVKQEKAEEPKEEVKAVEEVKEEPKAEQKQEEEKASEFEGRVEIEKPAEELKEMEEAAVAVFEKEEDSTIEEEEKATDAEVITIEPDADTKIEAPTGGFEFAFERPAAPEEPAKQKEITFEDYKDYKEPEFIKKEDSNTPKKAEALKQEAEPVKEEIKEEPKQPEYKDWRDWEPSKSEDAEPAKEEVKPEPVDVQPKQEEPKPETPKEEPKQESTVRGNIATRSDFERPKSLNDTLGKSITVGLNDRIAFEKNLFSGSTDDLNRVLSQLNTINTYDEAKDFIINLVKPDYNNWEGKEEYEERFMAIVEKKFS